MQYISLDYSRKHGMTWLTQELQSWLHLASISSHEPTKRLALGRVAEVRVK